MVSDLYWSRLAHHGNWIPFGPMSHSAGSRSKLVSQRYSAHDPPGCGYARALTNPITCCLAGQCLQANVRKRKL